MIQLQLETIASTDASRDAQSKNPVSLRSGSVPGLRIKVVSESLPFGLWAVKQLENAGHRVQFERSSVVSFEARHRAGIATEKLNALFCCVRPFFTASLEVDELLQDEIDVELYLGGESTESVQLSVHSDSSELLHRVSQVARDCGLAMHRIDRRYVSENMLKLNDNLGPFQRALMIWLAEQVTPDFHVEYEEHPHETPIAELFLRDERLLSRPMEQRYPVVLEGDESATMQAMRGWLESRGCEVEMDTGAHARQAGQVRLEVINGPFRSLEGRAFVEEVTGKLRAISKDQGIDPGRYPVQTSKDLSDKAVLRVCMPTKACREATARSWGGARPERFNVEILTDNPLDPVVKRLVARFRRAGWTATKTRSANGVREFSDHEILSTPGPGSVLVGALASYPTLLGKVKQMVNHALRQFTTPQEFECSVRKPFEDDDVDVVIHLPTVGMRDGEYRTNLNSFSHYDVTLMSPSPGNWEPLKRALEARGFHVQSQACPKMNPLIRYGGARPIAVEEIRATIGSVWKWSPIAVKAWPDHDRDIHIILPGLDAPLEMPKAEGVDGDEESADASLFESNESNLSVREDHDTDYRVESRSFLQVDGNDLLVGPLRLARRAHRASVNTPVIDSDYCIDNLTAGTLFHIAQSVLLREPCLLEGETASSKTSAIVHLASWLNQPLKRINLHGQTDTGDLIGRFVPNAAESTAERVAKHADEHAMEHSVEHSVEHSEEYARQTQGSRGLGWRWMEGDLLRAMREGWWVVLDEVNLAEPQILERLNSLLEFNPSLIVTEFNGEKFGIGGTEIHPDFRIFATMNPVEYAGRSALSPAYKDRWSGYLRTSSPGEVEYRAMLGQLVLGTLPEVCCQHICYRGKNETPRCEALGCHPQIHKFLNRLSSFHASLEAAASHRAGSTAVLGADRKEKFVVTRRSLLSVIRYLTKAAERPDFDLQSASRDAFDRYYLNRTTSAADRATVEDLLNACGLGSKNGSLS